MSFYLWFRHRKNSFWLVNLSIQNLISQIKTFHHSMEETVFARQLVSTVKRVLGQLMKIRWTIENAEIVAKKKKSSPKKTMMLLVLRVTQMMRIYWGGKLNRWSIEMRQRFQTLKINLEVIFNFANYLLIRLHEASVRFKVVVFP